MTTVSMNLFGAVRILVDGQPAPSFPTKKVEALLCYLAAERAAEQRREMLMTLLWPGMPERSARHNLRQTLYHLRKAIPEVGRIAVNVQGTSTDAVPLIVSNRRDISIHPEAALEVDVIRFEALISRTKSHDHVGLVACGQCQDDLKEASALYQGDFLADLYVEDSNEFEEWSESRREYYRRRALDALEILTTIATRQKSYVDARAYAERQLNIDNLRESAYRQMMEALALSGRREEALAIYENCRRLLAEELAMEPAAQTTRVYERILAGDISLDAPLVKDLRGYELRDVIDEGSYGTVRLGIQPSVDREVAVKVIRRRYANNPEFIRRFEAEAQTVARLEHPHIVPLYDYWRDPDGAYLVMRYMRGGSLLSALQSGPWDVGPVLKMMDQVTGALATAHKQGIVHRDIKPANILLDEAGNAYLSDFGIAKSLNVNNQLTADGAIVGTPEYISPEQILNQPVTPRTDIYSLGAVLYETLTGEKPYPDSSMANLIYKHLNESVPLVSDSRPDLPPQIDEVIQRSTAKRPEDRYADALEMAEAFRLALRSSQLQPAGVATPLYRPFDIPEVLITNPYKGLRAFQETDADNFFGREALIDQLLNRLAESRFLAVVGPSGSGKSSAVKAGLIPVLREGAIPAQAIQAGSEKWFVAEMVPGTHPFEELELALWSIAVDPPPSLVEPMQKDTRGMLRTIRRVLPDEEGVQLLLVIDQLEELFTMVDDEERRDFFIDSLLAALRAPRSPLRVVATLRADFYDRPLQFQSLGHLLKANTEIVLPMTAEELTWAIREPARHMGVGLEEGLAELIVADVADQPGSLPLMQYALTELFEHRQGKQMTREAYQEIGGVLGALGRRAEELYANLTEDEQEAARQLFLRLVTLGEGVEDTRRRVLRSELEAIGRQGSGGQGSGIGAQGSAAIPVSRSPVPDPKSQISTVIDAFGLARLLTFDRDPATRGATVEVAHEALLREWTRLRSWLDESRDDIRLQQRLARATGEWLTANRDESYLLHGARLARFEGWSEAGDLALTGEESAFLAASIDARQARRAGEERRRKQELETARRLAETEKSRAETETRRAEEQANAARRLRQRAVGLAVLLVVAVILAGAAIVFGQASGQNAALAATREAEAVANAALAATREVDAQQSADIANTRQAEAESEAVQRAEAEAEAVQQRQEAELQREAAEQQARLATSRELSLAALNNLEADPELSMLLALQALDSSYTKEAEEALHRGLQTSRVLKTLSGHTGFVQGAVFSQDETLVATVSLDGTVKIWETASGLLLHTLPYSGIDFSGHTLKFDDSGSQLAMVAMGEGFESAILDIWDVDSGTLISDKELPVPVEYWTLDMSPDWQMIVFGRENGTAELWDVDSAEKLLTLSGHDAAVRAVMFSPDGSLLVTTSVNGQVQIWDVESSLEAQEGQLALSFETSNQARLAGGIFNVDNSRLLLTYGDSVAEVWNLDDIGQPPILLKGHKNNTLFGAFHPSNTWLATASADGTAKVWDWTTGDELFTLSGHKDFVRRLAFSSDGRRLVTAGHDGTARIWNTEQFAGGEMLTFSTPGTAGMREFTDLKLSPDGGNVALGSFVGPATVWDALTGELLLTLGEADSPANYVSFNPDGSRIATAGEDGVVRIWDAENGGRLLEFTGHTGDASGGLSSGIEGISYSPDGSRLATAGSDGLAKVWDAETGQELLTLAGHTDRLVSLAYAPDGRTIATASDELDTTVKVWDALSGEEIHSLGPNPGRAFGLDFSPDGELLATGGQGGFLKVWDMSTGEEASVLTGQSSTIGRLFFTQDGQRLITAGVVSVSIWDVASGTELLNLVPRSGGGFDLTQDGRLLYRTDSLESAVGVYTVQLEDAVNLAQERLTRTLTEEECRQYLHLETCPVQ